MARQPNTENPTRYTFKVDKKSWERTTRDGFKRSSKNVAAKRTPKK